MSAEPPQTLRDPYRKLYDQLRREHNKLSNRLARLEKMMYVTLGVVSATCGTVLYDLLERLGAK